MDDDYICVDIDNEPDSKKFLHMVDSLNIGCSVLQTDHGMHFYFQGYDLKTNKIGWYTPIGIKADFKLGIKNTADPLRIDGKSRHWLRQVEDYDELPKWLYPTSNHRNHLDGLQEGDGRNQKLFNYILTLQGLGMSREEIRKTIKLINDYILAEPLPDKEVNIILRDDAFLKESFFIKNTFLHDKFAKFLIAEHHIIKLTNVLHIYQNGVYSDDVADIEKVMIKHISSLNRARRQEVLAYLQLQAPDRELAEEKYIAVKNGIYNLETGKLQDFDPSIIIKNKVPVNFTPGAYYDVTDHTLSKIANSEKNLRLILEEIFGYVLFRRNELGKAFILTGNGSNGKSSYLKIVRQLVGADNTSSLDLKELNQRFKTAELFGKLANIGDDISNEYIKSDSEFKKLVTGEAINVERKSKDPFDFTNYAKLVFSANKMPRINDNSDGLSRRLLFIPFKAKFSPNDADFDPFITDKLLSDQSMEYVLQLGIKGLKRLLKNHKFTTSKTVNAEADRYAEINNPIIAYLREEEPKFINEVVKDTYVAYTAWCALNGYKAVGQGAFSRSINSFKDLTTKLQRINGDRKRIFVEK